MELSEIKGIGEKTEKKLHALGVFTPEDLIERLPKGYMDMSKFTLPRDTAEGEFCLFEGKIVKIGKPFSKGKLEVLKCDAECEGEIVHLVWFNRNYTVKTLKNGEKYRIYGKLKIEKNQLFFYNPIFEENNENTTFFGIHPIYWTKGSIPQKTYRDFVKSALEKCFVPSIIEEKTEIELNLPSLSQAYRDLHFPLDMTNKAAKDRVALEKITRRICAYRIAQNRQIKKKTRKYDINTDHSLLFRSLPFSLNESQKKAIKKIEEVCASDKKVNAVLCGDVGSGKTAVAVAVSYFVVKNGYRVAIMAPTEILAKQHFSFINPIFSKLGFRVGFLSGSAKIAERNRMRKSIKDGFFDIVIGTHSLLHIGEEIPSLGLVVLDEQHRFGVAQRTGLIAKGEAVDVLTLSATPIPRSMQLVAYGELEYVTIKRRYESTVKTAIVRENKREDMWRYVSKVCLEGGQAYVIAPKIYDAEGIESESVENLSEELKLYFDEGEVGVLHGKLKAEEKQSILDDFYEGNTKVLVSTTVVEVGIDVPNASIITVMDAEKFGLATLHQLRGRVGRNGQKAYCFLYTEKEPTEGLKTLCSCSDGFEIAEKDFEMRGGGDVFGLEQSGGGGIEGLTYRTLQIAKEIADKIDLSKVENMLKREIEGFSLSDVSMT